MTKYRNIPTTINGIKFDSKKESRRYQELKLMERAGSITDLQLQVPFVLFGPRKGYRVIKYISDFVYQEKGKQVVEDVKGMKTPVYNLKKRLMKEIHDIDIKEV